MLGRIGTLIWNLRFQLGMWVGGFTSARRDYPSEDEDGFTMSNDFGFYD